MALGALTLSVTAGVQGRPFQATINGLTTGRVEVLGDGSPGFSTVNGKVMSSGLPYPVSTVVLREYDPGQGQGYRDSRIDITAATATSLRAQAIASLGAGRSLVRYRVAGDRQSDGSIVYSLKVEDDLGATASMAIGGAVIPAPAFTAQPSISPTSGAAGTTIFTFAKGAATNADTIVGRVSLNGSSLGDLTSFTPTTAQSGTLTYDNVATGAGGSTTSPLQTVTIAAAAASALSSINADGWSAQWASGTPPTFQPDMAPQTVSVSRQGFDATATATTVTENVVLTQRVRQPWPNNALLTAATVAVSDYVYSTDTIAGVANNSAEISPKPIMNWVMPHRAVIGNSIGGTAVPVEIVAAHRNARGGREVAAVKFLISDGTTTIPVIVAATVVSGRVGDRNPVIVYRLPTTDITSLTAGPITVNAEVYPWIGGAASVAKSASDGNADRGFSPRYFLKNVALAANPPYAYVSASGNDTTGVVSTTAVTAAAAPFATIAGAFTAIQTAYGATTGVDGCIIRLGAGTFTLASNAATRTQKLAYVTIERDPTVPKASAILSFGAAAVRLRLGVAGSYLGAITTGCIRFSDISISRAGLQAIGNVSDTLLEVIFDNGVAFDNASNNAAYLTNAADYHYGTTFTNTTGVSAVGAATAQHRCWRGISIDLNGGKIENWLTVGSIILRPAAIDTGTTYAKDGLIFAFSQVLSPTAATCMQLGGTSFTGAAVIQNLLEWTMALAGNVASVSNDNDTASNTHVCFHNNTFVGAYQAGRGNIDYDEGSTPRTSKLMSFIGNIFVAIYTKSDVFRGDNQGNPEGFTSANPSTRTGNWPFMYGVGCFSNLTQFAPNNQALGGNENMAYGGLGSKIGTSWNVRQDPLFTNNQGTTISGGTSASPTYAAGAGGGTYTLQSGSPARGMVSSAVLSHDLAGNARPTTADAAGAYA